MIPFNIPYTREIRKKIAFINNYKDEADMVLKRWKECRSSLGIANPSLEGTQPKVNSSVIKSVFPGFQEFKGGGDRTPLQILNDARAMLGMSPIRKHRNGGK